MDPIKTRKKDDLRRSLADAIETWSSDVAKKIPGDLNSFDIADSKLQALLDKVAEVWICEDRRIPGRCSGPGFIVEKLIESYVEFHELLNRDSKDIDA